MSYREHITDDSPCWCNPTREDPNKPGEPIEPSTEPWTGADTVEPAEPAEPTAPVSSPPLDPVSEREQVLGEMVRRGLEWACTDEPERTLPDILADDIDADTEPTDLNLDPTARERNQHATDTLGLLSRIARVLEYADGESSTVEPEPTFGDRIRSICAPLADDIDADRDQLTDELGLAQAELATERRRLPIARERIGELIEELRYPIVTASNHEVEVVDVDALYDRLDGIFAGCASALTYPKLDPAAALFEIPGEDSAKGLRVAVNPDGTTFLWSVDPLVSPGFALSGRAARDLVGLLGSALPDGGDLSPSELAHCPFCGTAIQDDDQELGLDNWLQVTASSGMYHVECFGCGAETRFFDTRVAAVRAWNRRTHCRQVAETENR